VGARRSAWGRGVSEVFTAMLLVAVIAAVGVSIYLAASVGVQRSLQAQQRSAERAVAEALGEPAILYAYEKNSTGMVWIVIATGPSKVRVHAAYLDGNPLEPVNFTLPLTVPPETVEVIGPFRAPGPGVVVKISTDMGDVEAPLDLLP
jgi:hypothetical protein